MGNSRLCQGFPGSCRSFSWTDMPLDIHLHILGFIPFADLARLATVGKGMLALYKERLKERQSCIEARLSKGWPKEVTEGLSQADTAVPRDFIVSPPVSAPSQNICWWLCWVASHVGRFEHNLAISKMNRIKCWDTSCQRICMTSTDSTWSGSIHLQSVLWPSAKDPSFNPNQKRVSKDVGKGLEMANTPLLGKQSNASPCGGLIWLFLHMRRSLTDCNVTRISPARCMSSKYAASGCLVCTGAST
jgi:hypothetical protein